MTIAFIHRGTAILPEISAYRNYFEGLGYRTVECHPDEVKRLKPEIEWHFLGKHLKRQNPDALVIHEYASLSAAPFAGLKDSLKKVVNTKPDFRIFQNEYTRDGMQFNDKIPAGIRSSFTIPGNTLKENPSKIYDFVYAGTLHRSREPEIWLSWFTPGGPLEKRSLLVLAPRRPDLEKAFAFPWIQFHDAVAPGEVNAFLQQARFGINYQPDCPPFNQQPSSKLLAYAAAGIPIISTDYQWVREFLKSYGGAFYLIDTNDPKIDFKAIENFAFEAPNLKEWTIEFQLEQSGILGFLKKTGFNQEVIKPGI
ncbi:MAG: hypothetical protein MUE38_04400 [Flavihumibacter sp.]|nr:hypothetical protein [Flavihumibacter sp.]